MKESTITMKIPTTISATNWAMCSEILGAV
jgi:hypothetical protein